MRFRSVALSVPDFGLTERTAVEAVLASGNVVQGQEVAAFEAEFSDFVDGRHCVAVNSGTSALHLSLLAAGIGPGDEVIVPSFTFAATANAVAMTGAHPIFADIDPSTFCLDADSVEASVTPRTAAIVPVHLYGQPAGVRHLEVICSRHGLLMLEDACQAHGAAVGSRPAGALGSIAAFSFYATKNMTTGEGGMVVTGDAGLARRVRLLRNQGMVERYRNEVVGLNNRMTDLAGAIGRVQLRRLRDWNERRRQVAARYDTELRGVMVPFVEPGVTHVYHQYTIRHHRRDELREALLEHGIETGLFYPIPAHRLPPFEGSMHLASTDLAASQVLSLPVRPNLEAPDVTHVLAIVNEVTESLND